MSRGNVHTVAKDSIQCSKSLVSLEDDGEGVLFKNTSMALFFWGTRIINSPAERFIISSLWCTAHQCKNSFHEVIMSCQTLKPFSSCFILTREAMWLSRRDPKWLVWIQRSRVWRHSEGRLWRGVRKRTLCCFSCILLLNYDFFFFLMKMWLDNIPFIRYNLVGKATRTCMSQGWDGRIPVCEGEVNLLVSHVRRSLMFFVLSSCANTSVSLPAVQCNEPPQVMNADLRGPQEPPYSYRTVVRYQCRAGTLSGSSEIWCTEDGTWSSPPPTCKGPWSFLISDTALK